jgi:hypothetical protein
MTSVTEWLDTAAGIHPVPEGLAQGEPNPTNTDQVIDSFEDVAGHRNRDPTPSEKERERWPTAPVETS